MRAEAPRWHKIIPLWALCHPPFSKATTYFVCINRSWQRLASGNKYILNQAINSDENKRQPGETPNYTWNELLLNWIQQLTRVQDAAANVFLFPCLFATVLYEVQQKSRLSWKWRCPEKLPEVSLNHADLLWQTSNGNRPTLVANEMLSILPLILLHKCCHDMHDFFNSKRSHPLKHAFTVWRLVQ